MEFNEKVSKVVEVIEATGEQLVEKVQELIREGKVRKITLKSNDGKELFSSSLTVGATGAMAAIVIAPVLMAAVGVAALVTRCTIEVEKIVSEEESESRANIGKED